MEKLAKQADWMKQLAAWKGFSVLYAVKPVLADKTLTVSVLSVTNSSTKRFPEVALSGNLREDRVRIHQLADAIHETFFGKPGIASTHLLYTVRTQVNRRSSDTWIAEVWEADYDGANPRQVTHEDKLCVSPTYVPPRKGFAPGSFFYVSYQQGSPKIYVASLRDGVGKRFSFLRGDQQMPAVSRQRDKVVFISDAAGNPDIFLQEFSPEGGTAGKPRQIFAVERGTQGSPTLSPDGNRIAFVSNKDGSPRIYLMYLPQPGAKEPATATLLSRQNKENTAPCWSSDGTKLAYSAMTNGVRQIWIYDFATKEERQVTMGPGNKENPTWAPNSLHLIFNSASANSSELYLVNLNQPEAVKISSGVGEKRCPMWEPR